MQLGDHARIPEQLLQGLPDYCIETLPARTSVAGHFVGRPTVSGACPAESS